MMNLGKKLGLATLLALGAASAANASALVLDTFDYVPAINLEVNSGMTSDTQTALDINALNGDVKYDLTYISGSLDGAAVSFDDSGDGVLSFSNDASVLSSLSLNYSSYDGTPTGPLDLTGGGAFESFYYNVLSSDLGFTVDISVGSGNTGSGSTDISVSSGVSTAISSLTSVVLDFSSFTTALGAGADFANVDFVNIVITGTTPAVDLIITEFGVTNVPEPTTVAIFGLALVGFAFNSKRKAK
jgi:hypothetical protein